MHFIVSAAGPVQGLLGAGTQEAENVSEHNTKLMARLRVTLLFKLERLEMLRCDITQPRLAKLLAEAYIYM